MGILPAYRGQGIGTRLLEHTLQKAKEFGLEKIVLQVYDTNTSARALYEKMGFTQEGYFKKYRKIGQRYFDSIAMAKFL